MNGGEIAMNLERSCGAVVFTRQNGRLLFVIVQERAGTYIFPKGHMVGAETEHETARREIFEETGLQPEFLNGFCQQEDYELSEKPGTRKRVTYFLAEFQGTSLTAQEGEIRQCLLVPYEDALTLIPHENTRRILRAAYTFLTRPEQ